MILLSLALVVASAVTLGIGVFSTSDVLVWVSLAAGLGAVALVAGSVVRRRRTLGPDPAIPGVTGPESAGAVAVTAPPPGPGGPGSLPPPITAAPGERAVPAPVPASPADGPGARSWPWSTAAPTGPQGWTGAVPDVRPPPPAADPAQPATEPATQPAGEPAQAGGPVHGSDAGQAGPPPAATPPPAARQSPPATPPPAAVPEPAVEDGMETVPVRDALRVAQLADEVLVADGQPRYHLAGCPLLQDVQGLPLAVSAARRAGFTPCAVCTPDRVLLARARARAAERTNDVR